MVSAAELQHLVKADFRKGIVSLFTGTGLALLVNIAALPILSRLYTPSEFGKFAFYLAVVHAVVVVVAGNFNYALLQPKKNRDALELALGGVVFSFCVSIFVAVAIYVERKRLSLFFDEPIYESLVWLIPVVGFALSVKQLFVVWETRKRRYRSVFAGKLFYSIFLNAARLPRHLYSSGSAGLWFTFLVSELLSFLGGVISVFKNDRTLLKSITFGGIKRNLLKYLNYPILSMPLSLLNNLSSNLLIFVFAFNFSFGLVGLYDRFSRLIGLPMDMFSNFLGAFFYKLHRKNIAVRRLYVQIYALALLSGLLLYLPVIFYGPFIFKFVLGDGWVLGGVIARYLAPMVILSFATKCMGLVFLQDSKNRIMLIWQLAYLLLSISWVLFFHDHGILFIVKTYSVLTGFSQFLLAVYVFLSFKKERSYEYVDEE